MLLWRKTVVPADNPGGVAGDGGVPPTNNQSVPAGNAAASPAGQPAVVSNTPAPDGAPSDQTLVGSSIIDGPWAPSSQPMPNFASPSGPPSQTTPATALAPASTTAGPAKHHGAKAIVTALACVVGAVLLVAACGVVGANFFQDHAKPGTEVFGRNVTGFSAAQVRNVAATIIDNYKATLQMDGHQVQADAQQLGLTFNLDQTVSNAMSAGSGVQLADQYNPFNAKNVSLDATVDSATLQKFLNDSFISDDQRAVSADVAFDADQGKFTVVPGKPGVQADVATVGQDLAEGQGFSSPLTVATTTEQPPITDDAAQQVADTANNNLLSKPYVLTAAKKSYTIPASDIGSWTTFTQDPDNGTITVGIDTAKIAADLPADLADNLTTDPVNQQNLYGPVNTSIAGTNLGVQTAGVNGTQVADPAAVATSLANALTAGNGLTEAVDVTIQPFGTTNVNIPDDGTKWIEVNLTNFTVTRWEGANPISTWKVVIGKPSTPTYTGIYHVFLKYDSQTMSGEGYVQPNVQWISYFNPAAGGIALHGNDWATPGTAASHGCVGMPIAEAKIIYDWDSIGTMVVVHN